MWRDGGGGGGGGGGGERVNADGSASSEGWGTDVSGRSPTHPSTHPPSHPLPKNHTHTTGGSSSSYPQRVNLPPPSPPSGPFGGVFGGSAGPGGPGAPPGQVYAPYFFNIGSVESFERKLESAQVRLLLPPTHPPTHLPTHPPTHPPTFSHSYQLICLLLLIHPLTARAGHSAS